MMEMHDEIHELKGQLKVKDDLVEMRKNQLMEAEKSYDEKVTKMNKYVMLAEENAMLQSNLKQTADERL